MKKKTIYIIGLILVMLSLSGCVKYEATMTIKNDKSMDFSLNYAINNELLEEDDTFDNDTLSKMKENGYTITDYKEENMTGYTFSKKYDNIDNYSTENDNAFNLREITTNKNPMIFKVKKGLLKNKYTAKFIMNLDEETNDDAYAYNFDNNSTYEVAKLNNEIESENRVKIYLFTGGSCQHCIDAKSFFDNLANDPSHEYMISVTNIEVYDSEWNQDDTNMGIMLAAANKFDDDVSGVPYIVIGTNYSLNGYAETYDDEIINAVEEAYNNRDYDSILGDIDYEEYEDNTSYGSIDMSGIDLSNAYSAMDMKFKVVLPVTAISNNANENVDNKTLIWDLTDSSKEYIQFEFELYNLKNIYIIAGGGIVLILIIVLVIISVSKKNGKKGNVVPAENIMETTAPLTPTSFENPALPPQNIPEEQVAPVVEPAPIVEEQAAPVVEPTPIVEEQVAPVVEPTPIVEEQVAPVVEPTPIVEAPIAPVAESAPIVEAPVSPVVEPTPIVEAPVAPVVEPTPIVETPIAPVAEPAPIVEEPIAPVVEPTPIIEEQVAPVVEPTPIAEAPVAPVVEPTPIVEAPIAPVAEPTPIVEAPIAPVAEPTPIVEEPVAPVAEPTPIIEEPIAPVLEPTPIVEEPTAQIEINQ